MALFRKKVAVEAFWAELFGEFYSADITTQDCLWVLFPECILDSPEPLSLLASANLTREEFIQFKVIVCCTALTCISYRQPQFFPRFREFFLSSDTENGLELFLRNKDIEPKIFTNLLIECFVEQKTDAMPQWALNGSKVVGTFNDIRQDVAERGRLSNVAITFIVDFYASRLPTVSQLIKNHPGESRDQFMYLLAALQRLENYFLRHIRPV